VERISGIIFVADLAYGRIQVFTPGGHLLSTWGGSGRGNVQLAFPGGIAVSASGLVYLTSSHSSRRGGDSQSSRTGFLLHRPLASPVAIQVCSYTNSTGFGSDPASPCGTVSGKVELSLPHLEQGTALSSHPVNGDGSSRAGLISDLGSDRIHVFTPGGSPLVTWGALGTAKASSPLPERVRHRLARQCVCGRPGQPQN
jgi:hypothetical protein